MKNWFLFFSIHIVFSVSSQTTFSGTVRSSDKGDPLPGATIYFSDLRNGTVSKPDGSFEVKGLPLIRTLVQVKLLGYKTIAQTVDLREQKAIDFKLEESIIEANEVVVTGASKATEIRRHPAPMAFIDSK